MSEHTKGVVAWQKFGKQWCLTGQHSMRPIILSVLNGALTSRVNDLLVPFDPNHPDARRLVACWNACEGMTTEAVERLCKPNPTHIVGELERDRDELLAALRDLLATRDAEAKAVNSAGIAMENYGDPCPEVTAQFNAHIAASEAERKARAILAKHKDRT